MRPLFTRKHHAKVAERIAGMKDRALALKLAHEQADMFAADNPTFRRATFYMACGLKP